MNISCMHKSVILVIYSSKFVPEIHLKGYLVRNEIHAKMMLQAQQAEITEHHIYNRLAEISGDEYNSEILRKIAADEKSHYDFWTTQTGKTMKPNRFKIFLYTTLARLLGLTFAIRLMERREDLAQDNYRVMAKEITEAQNIEEDEHAHEEALIDMLEEEKLQYASSIVLGLNDALVELTGAIAGLTFALQNPELVAVAALVTGISASLSMAGSEYLSTKTDDSHVRDPLRASIYTGVAYIFCSCNTCAAFLCYRQQYLSRTDVDIAQCCAHNPRLYILHLCGEK